MIWGRSIKITKTNLTALLIIRAYMSDLLKVFHYKFKEIVLLNGLFLTTHHLYFVMLFIYITCCFIHVSLWSPWQHWLLSPYLKDETNYSVKCSFIQKCTTFSLLAAVRFKVKPLNLSLVSNEKCRSFIIVNKDEIKW